MLLLNNQIYSFITILAYQVGGMVFVRDNARRCFLVGPNQFKCVSEISEAKDDSTFESRPVQERVNESPQMYEQLLTSYPETDYADTNYYAEYPPVEYSESEVGAETMDAADSNQRLSFGRTKQVPSTQLFVVNVSNPVHSSDFISKLIASAKELPFERKLDVALSLTSLTQGLIHGMLDDIAAAAY